METCRIHQYQNNDYKPVTSLGSVEQKSPAQPGLETGRLVLNERVGISLTAAGGNINRGF